MKTFLCVFWLCLSVGVAATLTYTRTLGEVYILNTATPQTSTFVTNREVGFKVGNGTNTWQSNSYSIDWLNDQLVKNGTNVVGPLYIDGLTKKWNAQRFHGFVIDNNGTAFLLTADDEDANVDFLVWIDLATGHVTNYININTGVAQSRINSACWGVYFNGGSQEK